MLHALSELLLELALLALVSALGGLTLAIGLRLRGLRWTWSAVLAPLVLLVTCWSAPLALAATGACVAGCLIGMAWHSSDLMAGGDHAQIARSRMGVLEAAQRALDRWQEARTGRGWVHDGCLEVGRGEHGRRVSIPIGAGGGSHTLVLGATGTGKTCGQAWIAGRLIEHGHGAIAIDPKGDELLCEELRRAAERRCAPFMRWTPQGPLAYNPYAYGSDTEIADKALAGETFSEPHYLRQAQRYLGHAVRTMRAARVPLNPVSLMAHMEPMRLEATARALPAERAAAVHDYLDSLGERQRRELAGVRDRLSILAESDVAPWLATGADASAGAGKREGRDGSARREGSEGWEGNEGSEGREGREGRDWTGGAISLQAAVARRAVVYFVLDADRRPLLAQMLAAAIVADLVTLAAHRQREPLATLVLIDEFSAVCAAQVGRLFGRGRTAGMSLLLSTQEIADLRASGDDALRDQAIGNAQSVVAYRQNVPESAALIAAIAGTRRAWITSQQTTAGLLAGRRSARRGSRTRGHEHVVEPSRIKQLRTGEALVIALGSGRTPEIARMRHPDDARRPPPALSSPRATARARTAATRL